MVITSKQNALVKRMRNLKQRKYRFKERAFLLEGIKCVEEALKKDWHLEEVIYSGKLLTSQRGEELLNDCHKRMINCTECGENILHDLADTKTEQGIMAVASMRHEDYQGLWQSQDELLLVLVDGVQDPGNLGTIIRTAAAMGAEAVFLTKGTVDHYSEKVIRSAMGSFFYLPVYSIDDLEGFFAEIKEKKIKIIAGDLEGASCSYDVDMKGSLILCLGNEGHGISELTREAADVKVKIPMPGDTESFNVGIAAGILLYEAVRQRR